MADKGPRAAAPTARGHETTWGGTEAAKQAWVDKHAEPVRKAVEKENKAKELGDA